MGFKFALYMKKTFSFVGAGKMAAAIIEGMLRANSAQPSAIECSCGADKTGEELSLKTGISLSKTEELSGEIIVLACKPQQLETLKGLFEDKAPELLISILAGTKIEKLRKVFPKAKNIVRIMPNMPALIGHGISCYASEQKLSEEDKTSLLSILSAIGESIECLESDLDAVTALSGSGPAYVFEFARALTEAGMALGFSKEFAKKLTVETLLGSALLLKEENADAEKLRIAVSSPGGTTLAALAVFDEAKFPEIVKDALFAAKNRAAELSKL